jgi:beta-glucosidase
MTVHGSSTTWPSNGALGTSWDRSLAREFGEALGKEFKLKGVHVCLGPAVNVNRLNTNGRNYEYLSGEDP